MVVSLIGRIWITFCLVRTAQSTNFFKSPKSPTPQLDSERNEKTGIATPAAFHCGRSKCAVSSCRTYKSPCCKDKLSMRRFSPVIQASPWLRAVFHAWNLYSNGAWMREASNNTYHSLGPHWRMTIGFSQFPNEGWLPLIANFQSGCGNRGQRTFIKMAWEYSTPAPWLYSGFSFPENAEE